ncbi:MAG: YggT family protein [Monoglobales bacterium]
MLETPMLKIAILRAIGSLFKTVEFLIIANALLSWFPIFWQNPTLSKIAGMINWLIEPIIRPIRKFLNKTPAGGMPIDISPIAAILLLGVLQNILVIIILAVK